MIGQSILNQIHNNNLCVNIMQHWQMNKWLTYTLYSIICYMTVIHADEITGRGKVICPTILRSRKRNNFWTYLVWYIVQLVYLNSEMYIIVRRMKGLNIYNIINMHYKITNLYKILQYKFSGLLEQLLIIKWSLYKSAEKSTSITGSLWSWNII